MKRKEFSYEPFGEITDTWNPITGCLHKCTYCWARSYSERLSSMNVEPYKTHLFKPALAEWRLRSKFRKGHFIFVSDMGDMWGDWVSREWIESVLGIISANRDARFLFLTKNPRRYLEFRESFCQNVMLGATIETNRDYKLTKAPPPRERYEAMKDLEWRHKAVVIEPVLEFDREFIDWIKEITPEIVYVGYDNYNNKLPEPPMEKTEMLIRLLTGAIDIRPHDIRKAWYE